MVTTAKPNIAETIAGFNGGMLTLSGSGISPYAKLKINGFTATLTNVTDASATALVPPLITTITQSAYSLTTPSKLLPSQFTTISDTPSAASLTFDGTHSTSYFSTGATCYVGIDVGAGLVLQATRIRYFPYSRWAVAANYLFGSIFEGSNDNSVWKTISTVAQDVHAGWNTIQVKATNTYRYLRFRHTSVSQCRLAEL